MTIHERAAAALVRAREAGVPVPASTPPYRRRLRAALTRDVAALLGVPPEHVVVTDDPARCYGGVPGQLITVHDPDDPTAVLRFIPEPGNTGTGGGAYLLLDACPGCSDRTTVREVPTLSIAGLADLGHYHHRLAGHPRHRPDRYPSSSSTTPSTHRIVRSDDRNPPAPRLCRRSPRSPGCTPGAVPTVARTL